MKKRCKKCGEVKNIKYFYKKGDIFRTICKLCYKDINKKINDKHNKTNYEKRKELSKKYNVHVGAVQYCGLKNTIAVYQRAKNKCEICGENKKLDIHHIDGSGSGNVKKLKINNDIENLMLLCHSCHSRLHGQLNKGKKHKRHILKPILRYA